MIQRGQRAVSVLCVDSHTYGSDEGTLAVDEYDRYIFLGRQLPGDDQPARSASAKALPELVAE